MEEQELRGRICRLDAIASPSTSLDRILDLAADCESDIRELTRAIETDPGITSKVLRLSNSAFFGVPGGVATVERAILVIGYKNVLSLATCAALAPVFAGADDSLDRDALWIHSCASAEAARLLAEAAEADAAVSYVAGLLHDLGVVVLSDVFGKDYGSAIAESRESGDGLARAEVRHFGVDHGWAACVLFERWTLPPELCRAVARHHEPGSDDGELAARVAISSHLAAAAGFPGPDGREPEGPPPREWLAAAGLAQGAFEAGAEAFERRRALIELGAGLLRS